MEYDVQLLLPLLRNIYEASPLCLAMDHFFTLPHFILTATLGSIDVLMFI